MGEYVPTANNISLRWHWLSTWIRHLWMHPAEGNTDVTNDSIVSSLYCLCPQLSVHYNNEQYSTVQYMYTELQWMPPPVHTCMQAALGCVCMCVVAVALYFKHLLDLPSFMQHVMCGSRLDRREWAHVHCCETRWRAAETGGRHRASLWEEGVQTGGPQTSAGILGVGFLLFIVQWYFLCFNWVCVCLVCQASEDLLREHYWDLRSKPFFSGLIQYMSSGPIVAMVRFSHILYRCPQDTTGSQKLRGLPINSDKS